MVDSRGVEARFHVCPAASAFRLLSTGKLLHPSRINQAWLDSPPWVLLHSLPPGKFYTSRPMTSGHSLNIRPSMEGISGNLHNSWQSLSGDGPGDQLRPLGIPSEKEKSPDEEKYSTPLVRYLNNGLWRRFVAHIPTPNCTDRTATASQGGSRTDKFRCWASVDFPSQVVDRLRFTN